MLVVPNENHLSQGALEPIHDWKIVPDLDLRRFVDDQRLNWNDSRDFAHLAVEHGAQSG